MYADRNRLLNLVDDYVYSPGDPLTSTKKRDLMVSHIRYILFRHSQAPKFVPQLYSRTSVLDITGFPHKKEIIQISKSNDKNVDI